MTIEQAWIESQETRWTLANGRTLSSMTYVGIGIHPMTGKNPNLRRWLGVSHRIGSSLCYWILNDIVTVLARTTVQHVTQDEIANTDIMNRIRYYHKKLEKVIGDDQYVSTDSKLE